MARVRIDIYNTYFTVNVYDQTLKHIIQTMCGSLVTYTYVYDKTNKRNIKQKDKTYYAHQPLTNLYRFSINSVKDFMLILGSNNIKREDISVRYFKNREVASLNLKFNPKLTPYDYQERYVNALTEPDSKNILLIDLAPGRGKSLIAMLAIVKLNFRTGIIVLPKYIEKWIDDVKKYTDVDDEDIYVVQGSASLVKLMEEENITYKFIIFSMRTMSNYIKNYEDNEFLYNIKPEELMCHLKIGTMLSDETHQEFHALYKTMLYFDPLKFIGLSATLDTNQSDIKYMYNVLFPPANRVSNLVEYIKYINVKAISYKLGGTKGILYKRPQGYSHNLYEQSILKNNVLLRDYIEMIIHYLKEGYLSKRKPGDRALIFAASIHMCTLLTNYIKELCPTLDVRRYVENDPYINILEADICISTILSSGTAIDINSLIFCFQTVSISSLQANVQAVGRLRKIEDKEVYFYYIYTRDISNQYKMHNDRREAIKHMAKTYVYDDYFKHLKTK